MSRPDRGQSNVVGVALLLAITVVAVGGMTAGIGAVIDSNAAAADATSVADGFDEALQPTTTTGHRVGEVRITDGQIGIEPRRLRVLDESGPVETVAVDALVYESGERRVAYHGDAIVRGTTGNAWFHSPPGITLGAEGPLIVNAPRLDTDHVGVGGGGPRPLELRTDVTHERERLGTGRYRIAVETSTPGPWKRFFADRGATIEATDRQFPGDRESSVVARIGGDRTAYLVTHDLRLEVRHG